MNPQHWLCCPRGLLLGCVQPVVNRGRLSSYIGGWTFLWPVYAVSLLLGDFFGKIGGRFVCSTFADTFKI